MHFLKKSPFNGIRILLSTASLFVLAAGCEDGEDVAQAPSTHSEVSELAISGPILPSKETQTYQGFAKPASASDPFPIDDLAVLIDSVGADRTIEVRRGDTIEGPVLVDANGEMAPHQAENMIALDAVGHLPRANTALTLGHPYSNPMPTPAFVVENASRGELTISQRIENTPRLIAVEDFGTIVRLDTLAFHHISMVDPKAEGLQAVSPQLRSFDIGLAYAGVVDLLYIPDDGWRVLQFTRLAPAEEGDESETLDELRARPHHRFTACGAFDTIDAETLSLARQALPAVEELTICL